MQRLLHSAKFWTLILDVVIQLATYFVAKYAAPEISKDILYVIGLQQPIWVMVIGAFAYEDGKEKGAPVTHVHNYPADSLAEFIPGSNPSDGGK